tara:strand:+ start:3222 stop:4433 length:1212 start_codon:yes stop_codon:yes gene_type:complete
MIQAITKTNLTTYLQTEDNRINTSVATSNIRHLLKFTNVMSKSVQYAYGATETINNRFTKFTFDFNISTDIYTGKIDFEPAGYWTYEVYEVSWIGTVSVTANKAPVSETDVLPVDNDNGVVQGLVTKGKMYVDEKSGTEQVQYTQHPDPGGTNYIFYGSPQFSKYSCTFDGLDAFIAVNDSSALRPTSGLTISLWMKPKVWNITTGSDVQYALGCVSSGGWGIKLVNTGANITTLQFELRIGSGYIYATIDEDTTEAFTGWKNIIATYDQDTGLSKIYHNNDTTGTTNGSTTAGNPIGYSGSPVPLLIGADAATATPTADDFFDGSVDDVAIFNTEVTADQRAEIYNFGKPDDLSKMSGLIGYWRMGDPDGQSSFPTIVDVTTNGNNGTMNNMTASDITSDVP